MPWYELLVLLHIIGTVLGVGGATFIELYLIYALRDGVVTPEESTFMQISYNTLRVGFFFLVISGFGFLLLARLGEHVDWFYSIQFWIKLSIVALIAVNAIIMHYRLIPLMWGSAIALTSWYAALTLGVVRSIEIPIPIILGTYAASVVMVYLVLRMVHSLFVTPLESRRV